MERKFFIIFAYPGVSGFLHVGHLRSYTYPDIIAKYKRLMGYKVFFPVGLHASGLPTISFSLRVKRRDPVMINHLKEHGVDEETIKRLEDPLFALKFFGEKYLETWKALGFEINEECFCTTVDEGYKRFIRWQMKKLEEKGYLIQKPHHSPYCPVCGPVAVDPSETDISKGGDAKIIELTIVKAKVGEYILPISLVEEKKIEKVIISEGEYLIIEIKGEKWIVNKESAKKFEWQKDGKCVGSIGEIREMVGSSLSVDGIEIEVEYSSGKPWFGSGIIGILSGEKFEYKEKDKILDFDKEVVCRCKERVYIKPVPDQWFIRYSDEELKRKTKEWVKKMTIVPKEYQKELINHVIDWYGDRACTRKGRWLGTDWRGWIVEPISDSVIYPAYYIVSKYINEGKIRPENLSNSFFDYVFLGEGNVEDVERETGTSKEIIEKIRKEFEFWYPVDLNCGGKEHKTVHFPVYIMVHLMVFPEKYWPRGIFVNWWVVGKKGKISKSKGGAEPIPNLVKKYGADTLRLFYAMESEPWKDVVWDEEKPLKYLGIIRRIREALERLSEKGERKDVDDWIESRLVRLIEDYIKAMDEYDIRKGILLIWKFIEDDLEWYFERGGEGNKRVLKSLIEILYPFTPFLSKEFAEKVGFKIERIERRGEINKEAERVEEYLKEIIRVVEKLRKLFERKGMIPKKVLMKFSSEYEREIFEKNKEFLERKINLSIEISEEVKKEAKPWKPAIEFVF